MKHVTDAYRISRDLNNNISFRFFTKKELVL